jgi:hypothetical protein
MTTTDAKGLMCGDEVFWNDPDSGECSRYITISSIKITGSVATIRTADGDCLECFVSELE